MIRRTFHLGLRLGLLVGLGYAVLKVRQRREDGAAPVGAPTWPPVTPQRPGPSPEPVRAESSAAPTPLPRQAWVEPSSDGLCPQSHPIRAKLSSKIFHLPGMFAYERTNPDRCYAAEDAAVADGFRKAKR